MLTKQHTQECLSIAYVHALAGKAGVNVNIGETHDYGVDGMFRRIAERAGRRVATGTAVDFQLKASTDWAVEGPDIVYDLEAKAYNDLVTRQHGIGFILILLCLPATDEDWLIGTEEAMILRNCCYWYRPEGPPVPNVRTKRIRIPRANLLTVNSIREILEDARNRELGL